MRRIHKYAVIEATGLGPGTPSPVTEPAGASIPARDPSSDDARSQLRAVVAVAERVVGRSHVFPVVTATHCQSWRHEFAALPASNRVVQPLARGSGMALLLALLLIEKRDRGAFVLSVPARQRVTGPEMLQSGMDAALSAARASDTAVRLECPPILAGSCESLLRLFDVRFPEIVMQLRTALGHGVAETLSSPTFRDRFAELPEIDLGDDILMHSSAHIRVLPIPGRGPAAPGGPDLWKQLLPDPIVDFRGV